MYLLNQWDNFVDKIIPYMHKEGTIKDKWCKEMLNDLKINSERSVFLAILI